MAVAIRIGLSFPPRIKVRGKLRRESRKNFRVCNLILDSQAYFAEVKLSGYEGRVKSGMRAMKNDIAYTI